MSTGEVIIDFGFHSLLIYIRHMTIESSEDLYQFSEYLVNRHVEKLKRASMVCHGKLE